MYKFLFYKKTKILIAVIFLIAIVSSYSRLVFAAWNGSLYTPGSTLNPECLPTDVNCDVESPITSTAGLVTTDQSTPQTIGTSTDRLTKLWATNLNVSSAPVFSSLSEGSIMFMGASGVLSEDNTNLVWDNVNKQLQVGTPPTSFSGNPLFSLSVSNNVNSYSGMYTQNANSGVSASSDYMVGADNDGVDLLGHFGDFGIINSGWDPAENPYQTGMLANDIYLYGSGGNLLLGTDAGVAGKVIKFFVGGFTSEDQMATLSTTGLGIGTTTPGSALDVKGDFRISGSSSGYVGFAVPSAAGSTTYTLPSADGTNNYVLTTDGNGNLSWSDKTGGTPGTVSSINGDSSALQTIAAGSGLNIVNSGATHTLSLDTTYAPTWTGKHIFSNSTNSALFTGGAVGIGTVAPSGLLSVTPLQYSTGTASQDNSTTIVGSGTTWTSAMIGSQFVYADGTSAGTITAVADATHLTSSVTQTVSSQGYKISYTGLQVASNGNIGLGTTSPSSRLHVQGIDGTPALATFSNDHSNVSSQIRGDYTNNYAGYYHGTSGSSGYSFDYSGNLRLGDAGGVSDWMTVLIASGNVGIGTTNPSVKLEVNGPIYVNASSGEGYLKASNGSGQGYKITTNGSSSGGSLQNYDGSNTALSWVSGDVGIGTTSPAYKLDVAGTINTSAGIRMATAGSILDFNDVSSSATVSNGYWRVGMGSGASGSFSIGRSGYYGATLFDIQETTTGTASALKLARIGYSNSTISVSNGDAFSFSTTGTSAGRYSNTFRMGGGSDTDAHYILAGNDAGVNLGIKLDRGAGAISTYVGGTEITRQYSTGTVNVASKLTIGNGLGGGIGTYSLIVNNLGQGDVIASLFKGYSTQTADLTQWQNSSGTILAAVSKDGYIRAGGTSGQNTLKLYSDKAAVIIKGSTDAGTGPYIDYDINSSATADTTFARISSGTLSTATSGTNIAVSMTPGFTPSGTGTGSFRVLNLGYTLNGTAGSQGGTATGIFANATETTLNGMTHNLIDLQVGGTSKFKVSSTGALTTGSSIVSSGTNFQLGTDSGKYIRTTDQTGSSSASGKSWYFGVGNTTQADGSQVFFRNTNGSRTPTSGTNNFISVDETFAPTSGTAVYNLINIAGTVNQTGGANGITRSLYINPTLTAVADYRAVEISNNSGYGIYQSGASAKNYFNGNVGVGTTSPTGRLDVSAGGASQTAGDFVVDTANNIVYVGKLDSVSGNTNFIFRDRLGTVKSRWENAGSGSIGFSNFSDGYGIRIGPTISGSIGSIGAMLFVQNANSGSANPTAVFKQGTTQTGNLTEWQNSSGTALAYVTSAGNIYAGSNFYAAAGGAFIFNGRSYIASSADGQLTLSDNNGTGAIRLNFGGNTLSYPSIKRVNAGVQVIAADGTNNADLYVTGNVGIGTTTPGSNKLYVNGDEYVNGYLSVSSGLAIGSGISVNYHTGSGFDFGSTGTVGWWSSTAGAGSRDTGLSRSSAGVLKVTDGSSGDGTLIAGSLGVGTTSLGAQIQVNTASASTVGAIIKGSASQTANLQEWRDSSGVVLSTINPSGQMVIGNGGGQVGSYDVSIVGSGSSAYIGMKASGQSGFGFSFGVPSANNSELWNYGTGYLRIATNNTEYMRILSTGEVGIGTTTPGYKLEVGNSSVSGVVARFVNSSGTCDINPTTTALSCSSDRNLKTNISNLNSSLLDTITGLQPVTYNWNTDPNGQVQTGFIAQDVEAIFPHLVSTDANTGLKSLNYIGLIPYSIEAIKELDIRLDNIDAMMPNQNVATMMRDFFGNVVTDVSGVVVTMKEIVADTISAKKVKTDGIEMKDTATGQIYCVTVSNGEFVKNVGECAEIEVVPEPAPAPVPEPEPAPEVVPDPAPAPDPAPESIPAPEPESTPAPSGDEVPPSGDANQDMGVVENQ